MESDLFIAFDNGQLVTLILRVVAWLVVVVACLVAARRPWAWPGLAGGVLGLVAAATFLADDLAARAGTRELGAHVYGDAVDHDYPGFLADLDLHTELDWVQNVSLVLLAAAFVTAAVLSRRAQRSRPS